MTINRCLNRLKEIILDLLFPLHCVGCNREGHFICFACLQSIRKLKEPVCERCGIPIVEGKTCYYCRNELFEVDGIRAPFLFEGVIREAIYSFKYGYLKSIASCIAGLLWKYIQSINLSGDVIVPVPIHKSRMRQRGYNQSLLLSRELGKLCGLPVDDKSLLRVRDTKSQTALSLQDRRINVHDAFICSSESINGKKVLLIDDVCTTGATLEACAGVLKKSGALSVWGLTLARDISSGQAV